MIYRWIYSVVVATAFVPACIFGGANDDAGTGDSRSFDVTYQNLDINSIHMDFEGRTHGTSNDVEGMGSRVAGATATIGEFLKFEAGNSQVTLGSTQCQLTDRDPISARVVWDGQALTCAGFDGAPGPAATGSGSDTGTATSSDAGTTAAGTGTTATGG